MASRIGELLVETGKLDPKELERAMRLQRESGEPLGSLLVQLGFVSERDIASSVGQALELSSADADRLREPAACIARLSAEFMKRYQVLPVGESDSAVDVAMADPTDGDTLQALELALGRRIQPLIAVGGEIQAALQAIAGSGAEAVTIERVGLVSAGTADLDDIDQLRDMASEAPVIRTVNQLIARALEMRSSDIHIEPFEGQLVVRFRVDGVLRVVDAPPAASAAAVVSRIKVMSNLNIAERRLPQDGRIKMRVEGREVDMRISTVPTLHGESVVIRLLDQGGASLDLAQIGFDEHTQRLFERLLAQAAGHHPGHRPDRQRQDHDPLRGARSAQHAGAEDPHRRGSGRVPDPRRQPDPDQAQHRPDLRERPALDTAPGPGRDHDRRDARHRDGAHRRAGRADRAQGAVDAAHQRRAEQRDPPARHARGGLPADLDARRHPRAAAGAATLHALPPAVPARAAVAPRDRAGQAGRRQRRSISTGRSAARAASTRATGAAPPSWSCWS